ncbi:hypothetical protein D3C87_2110820 [compost metagenome]
MQQQKTAAYGNCITHQHTDDQCGNIGIIKKQYQVYDQGHQAVADSNKCRGPEMLICLAEIRKYLLHKAETYQSARQRNA